MVLIISKTLESRFWKYTDQGPEGFGDENGCFIWTGGTNQTMVHGVLYVGTQDGRGVSWGAHRVAWFLAHGRIPGELDVLHRCDVPPCVNYRHLFLGTQADNVRDMFAKGRARPGHAKPGEAHHGAKLTEADVIDIRFQVECGVQ